MTSSRDSSAGSYNFRTKTVHIIGWIKHEFISILPAIGYFFVAFSLLILNDMLILWEYGARDADFMRAAIGALVVAKVLMTVGLLPFIDAFPDRPLIWNTIWKTLIYWIGCISFQVIESMVRSGFEYGSLSAAVEQTFAVISSPRFLMVQMWLFVLLLMFVALQELGRALGPGRLRALFFGARTASSQASGP